MAKARDFTNYPAFNLQFKGQQVKVRRTTAADAEQMVALFNNDQVCAWLKSDKKTNCKQYLARFKKKDALRVRLAVIVDGRAAGFINFKRGEKRKAHTCNFGIGFLPAFWGTGLARTALSAAISQLPKLGIQMVHGDVFKKNKRARVFYRKLGFKEIGVLPRAYKRNGRLEDGIIIYKAL